MKTILFSLTALILCGTVSVLAQGTFVFDQQSADENTSANSGFTPMQSNSPLGQSFTPSLNAVGFIRLQFTDYHPGNSLGAQLYVTLTANSFSGTTIGTSATVALPDSFNGYSNFIFPTPVSVTPNSTYYLHAFVASGDTWGINVSTEYGYQPGVAYLVNLPSDGDLWFREGVVTPEPSTIALISLFGLALLSVRKKS